MAGGERIAVSRVAAPRAQFIEAANCCRELGYVDDRVIAVIPPSGIARDLKDKIKASVYFRRSR